MSNDYYWDGGLHASKKPMKGETAARIISLNKDIIGLSKLHNEITEHVHKSQKIRLDIANRIQELEREVEQLREIKDD